MRLAALLAVLLPLAMIRHARGLRCCSFIKYSRNTQRVPTARFAELANGQDFVAALAYDFETSSADPSSTEAVQLAVVCANSRHPDPPTFLRYVLPSGDIEDGALGVHGISKEFLVSSGINHQHWTPCMSLNTGSTPAPPRSSKTDAIQLSTTDAIPLFSSMT
jgi:hypothetical protein